MTSKQYTTTNSFMADGPPGLVHPLLVENYAWVDAALEKMCSKVVTIIGKKRSLFNLDNNEDELPVKRTRYL